MHCNESKEPLLADHTGTNCEGSDTPSPSLSGWRSCKPSELIALAWLIFIFLIAFGNVFLLHENYKLKHALDIGHSRFSKGNLFGRS